MDIRKWYQKKRYIFSILALGLILGVSNSNQTTPAPTSTASVYSSQIDSQSAQGSVNTQVQQPSVQTSNNLSNTNTYTNVDGNTIHSPAYSTNNQVPSGATAQCRDGSYSFSQHRSGTCSGHGGVARWL